MEKRTIILILGGIALFAWAVRSRATALPAQLAFDPETGQVFEVPQEQPAQLETQYTQDVPLTPDAAYNGPTGDIMPDAQTITAQKRLSAFLALIRRFESNDRYDVIYKGNTFADFSRHPNIPVPFTDPRTQRRNVSTAAGAYQINFPTWNTEIQPALNLPDFSPASQDAAAVYLLQRVGAIDPITRGDFANAIQRASRKWASLPGSTAMQNPKSYAQAQAAYNELLAVA
jgi:muramidase (phage lysozyme)